MATQQKEREIFETMPIGKAFFTLALPTILSQLIVVVYNLADTFYVGQTGNSYMIAAMSLSAPVFMCLNAVGNLFGIGGGSNVSRLIGIRQDDEAKKVSSYSFYATIIFALIYSLIVILFNEPLLTFLGASEQSLEYAKQYVLWTVIIGGPFMIVSAVLGHLLRSVGFSQLSGIGIGAGGVLNIILDPLFMFVLFPAGQEVYAAACATCISNVMVTLFFAVVLIKVRKKCALSIKPQMPSKESVKLIYNVGIPSALGAFLANLVNATTFSLMAEYGDTAIASLGIVRKLDSIAFNLATGLSQGMMPLIAYNYATRDYKRMHGASLYGRISAVVLAVVCVGAYTIFAEQLVGFFINAEGSQSGANTLETIEMGATFLRVLTLAVPFMIFNFLTSFTFQAMGKAKESLLLVVCRQGLVHFPILILFANLFKMDGILWTQFVSDGLTLLLALFLNWKIYKAFNKQKESLQQNLQDSTL